MTSVPGNEIPEIKRKFINAKQKSSEMNDSVITFGLFVISNKLVLVKIPYCPQNDASSGRLIKKYEELTRKIVYMIYVYNGSQKW